MSRISVPHPAGRFPGFARLSLLLAAIVAAALSEPAFAEAPGVFVRTGAMIVNRWGYTATLLRDGRVLIAGGYTPETSMAEIYDPATGSFTKTGSMTRVRGGHTATLLPDSRVLIVGGQWSAPGDVPDAELYDPATGTFTTTGPLIEQPPREHRTSPIERVGHTATLLPNGKVLIAGGVTTAEWDSIAAEPELYDPASGTFAATGTYAGNQTSFTAGVMFSTATLLADGRVLLAGGNPPEIYDPVSGTFQLTSAHTDAPPYGIIGHTAVSLGDGRVLVVGGERVWVYGGRRDFPRPRDEVEIFDPASGTFERVARLAAQRLSHRAAPLPNGTVLLTGPGKRADIFDPATASFIAAGEMMESRESHTMTPLADGSVLILGGGVLTAELFVPAAFTPPPPPPTCRPDAYSSCLFGRFRVEVRYRNSSDNGLVDTRAFSRTTSGGFADRHYETAFFYFNSPNNVEVVVKMLDEGARSGDLDTIPLLTGIATPLRIEVTVTDTSSRGTTKTYTSEFGAQAGTTDWTTFVK